MLYFDVVVYPQRVVVRELEGQQKTYHLSAKVDGEIWRYRITKHAPGRMSETWRGRGTQQAYYHAKNSGESVEFQPVSHTRNVARRKINPDQLRLFE